MAVWAVLLCWMVVAFSTVLCDATRHLARPVFPRPGDFNAQSNGPQPFAASQEFQAAPLPIVPPEFTFASPYMSRERRTREGTDNPRSTSRGGA